MTEGTRRLLLGTSAVCAVVTLVGLADAPDRAALVWIVRPLTLACLVALAAFTANALAASYRRLVTAGLLASLAGDVLLMLPGERFAAALLALLAAHLLYFTAFATRAPMLRARAAVIAYAAFGTSVLALVLPTVGGSLRVAMIGSVLASCVMAAQAAGWLLATPTSVAARLAALGAALLMCSGTLLALDRFVTYVPAGDALVLGTFWIAQACLAASVQRPPPPTMRM